MTFGGIQASSIPSVPGSVVAVGGVEQATLYWTVQGDGIALAYTSFLITPYLAGEIPLTPISVPVGPVGSELDPSAGAADQYTITGLLIGTYSFSVAAVNAADIGPAAMSNVVSVTAPIPVTNTPSYGIPHLALPLDIGPNGSFKTVQQDTIDEVAQCVEVILATPIGTRPQVPGFGVPSILFSQAPPNANSLVTAVSRWEDRANVQITTVAVDPDNDGDGDVSINAAVSLKVLPT